MVKRLRHRPFTAVTRVRISLGSLKRRADLRSRLLCIFGIRIRQADYKSAAAKEYADMAQFATIIVDNCRQSKQITNQL